LGYVADRLVPNTRTAQLLQAPLAERFSVPLRAGNWVAIFTRWARAKPDREKLSIVLPVYNEVQYVAQVVETILAKPLTIDKELIVVESNSTDGTREVVKRFEGRSGVRLIFEDRPRGKGHAVRAGLGAVTGTIVLIQDADFEYDVEDYDALLEPILQRKATFVLGSRSLGLDDWKVRRFGTGATKALALNVAQLFFAWTFNALYRQSATDINTMYKVFRTECLAGVDLESDGFNLDIELACKLARNGNSPMEVPVNYVARGFDEGKKISFVRDAIPSYLQIFKSWLG
jgi:glycosyltransferase involved in cell wall biosynthesis